MLDAGFGGRLNDRPAGDGASMAGRRASSIKHRASRRRGITLVELLITMAIMAILAAAIMGAASAAMESARRSRTQSIVTKIGGLINERMASYETRRVALSPAAASAVDSVAATAQTPAEMLMLRGQVLADMRLLASRELMKFEMPDRWSDITDVNLFIAAPPTSTQTMRRRLTQFSANATPEKLVQFQGAECLFQTVMLNTADGEARTLFSDQDIGDVDGDGAQEFIDGWGRPISWLRWPAGMIGKSPLMAVDPTLATLGRMQPTIDQIMKAGEVNHDPLDRFRRDDPEALPDKQVYRAAPSNIEPYLARLRNSVPAFRITPLVYSAGRDGVSDINTLGDLSVTSSQVALDPYVLEEPVQPYDAVNNPFQVGRPWDEAGDGDNSLDNIQSHRNEY
jgi:prepilin-type N-terminal cleavage/methylation domain-containing protein